MAKPTKAQAAEWADQFLRAGRAAKEAERQKAEAKAALLEWLDGAAVKLLPDGRGVTASTLEIPAATIERRAYTSITVTITPPPAR